MEKQSFKQKPISPTREMGAYEALWDREKVSFKALAELFQQESDRLPSEIVGDDIACEYYQMAIDKIHKSKIDKFGVIVYGSVDYPDKLRDARYPVELLYYQGFSDYLNAPKNIAIVGTRNPSREGVLRAKKLVKLLVKEGFNIVSGLAKGIDTVAHTTALENNGITIAVVGTPITESYPKENRELQDRIAKEFLLVSQIPIVKYYKQNYQVNRFFFPERNKTMSAISLATVIIEAGETSGTLVQARAALEQGRKLFILESNFNNPTITWPKRYEELGAIRVREFEDILQHV
jgi:DNA processing protein